VAGLKSHNIQLGRQFDESPPNARKSLMCNILTAPLPIRKLSHSVAFLRTLTRYSQRKTVENRMRLQCV